MKIGFRARKIFRKWMLSYIVLLIAPLVLGLAIYTLAISAFQNHLNESSVQTLEHSMDNVDAAIEKVQSNFSKLVLGGSFFDLAKVKDKYEVMNYVAMNSIQSQLKNIIATDDSISEVYLYFNKTGFLLNSKRYFREAREVDGELDALPLEEFWRIVKEKRHDYFAMSSDAEHDYLFYVESFSYGSSPAITVFFKLNEAYFRKALDCGEDYSVYMLTESQSFSTDGSVVDETIRKKALVDDERLFRADGQSICAISSQHTGIVFVSVIPTNKYFSLIYIMLWGLVAYATLCLIGGFLLAYYFAHKNYDPIDKIIELTGRSASDNLSINELNDLKEVVERLIHENTTYANNRNERYRAAVLYQLMQGNSGETEPLISQLFGGKADEDYSFALAEMILEKESIPSTLMERELFDFSLKTTVREQLDTTYGLEVLQINGSIFALFALEDEIDDADGYVASCAKRLDRIMVRFMQEHSVTLKVNISDFHHSSQGIAVCALELSEVKWYRELNNDTSNTITYREVVQQSQNDSPLLALRMALMRSVRNMDYEQTEMLADRIRAQLQKEREAIGSAEVKEDTVALVKEYIRTHYSDSDLSGQKIASEFNINFSYLSQLFSKDGNDGLLNYIRQTRVEMAKTFIREGFSIKDTAEKVGYLDTQPLVRAFKRLEKMNPSEYKKSIEK